MRYAVGGAAVGKQKPRWHATAPRLEGALRVSTLNIAHGRRLATHQLLLRRETVLRNLETIAGWLRSHDADVVALQEADGPSAWSGNLDHVDRLARLAGYQSSFRGDHNPFGSAAAPLRSGTALLVRGELSEATSMAFGTSWRDTKGFVVGQLAVPGWGLEVDVVSLHLDFLAPIRRLDQLARVADELAKRPTRPRILLGDFNCCGEIDPKAHEILDQLGFHTFEPGGGEATFPSRRPRLRLDWIFASSELRFVHYRTHARPLSDHLGVVADLMPVVAPTTEDLVAVVSPEAP